MADDDLKKEKSKEEKENELVWEDEEEKDETSDSVRTEETTDKEDAAEETKEDEEVKESEEEEQEEEEKEEGPKEEEKLEEETEENSEKEEPGGRPTHEEIRKSEVLRRDLNQFVRDNQPSYNLNQQSKRGSGKLITLTLFILAVLVIGGGMYFIAGIGNPQKQEQPTEVSTTAPEPTPTPEALNRSEWSFEVLNGSGVTGEAKRIADALKELGYQIVRVGNADNNDYTENEFYVQGQLKDKIDRVVVDIKDIIKIASISGELTDSTASARIIIGGE